jgi:lysyl-tRNA synthetase class 2
VFESEFEQNLYALRREKLKQIAALGQQAGLSEAQATYPNSYSTSHTIPELRAAFDSLTTEQLESAPSPITVRIAGRIMAIRVQGKAGFAQLQQGGLRMQIYVRKDDVGEDAFALYKLLDLGDHIGVIGHLFRTRTGELTVHVSRLTFLAKAMLALPDKYHGLEDTELRYRQRYVDLFMNTGAIKAATAPQTLVPSEAAEAENSRPAPETTEPEPESRNVREVFVKRAAILRAIRKFFDELGYLEVETPMMQQIPGGAAARPFTTHHNELDLDLYLRIAPELYLKRLVVGGFDRVYEINRNFRNEGVSTRHNPEFTMLEFYQAYANYHDLMRLTEELIIFVAQKVNGTTITHFNDHEIDLHKWQRFSMREAILHFWPQSAGAKPNLSVFASKESVVALVQQLRAAKISIEYDPSEPVGKTIATIFETVAEAHLIQPTIIYDFPLAVSPLSKIKPDEPEWVERFEFYIGGFEVGNAFSELNDPEDQRRRFEQQLEQNERGDAEAHLMDEDYVRALGYGLPPTAGEGIGIDRLTMLLTNSRSIRDVILFPLMRPIAKQQPADQPHGESAE